VIKSYQNCDKTKEKIVKKIIFYGKEFFSVKEKDKLNYLEKLFVMIFFIMALFWAVNIDMKHCPDEEMRYLLPQYLYHHGKLPLPNHPEVIHPTLKLTYAYYPFWLGAILSSIWMRVIAIFSTSRKRVIDCC